MLAFATLFAIAALLTPNLIQAAPSFVPFTNTYENSVVLEAWDQDDHPTIQIGEELLLDKPGGQKKLTKVAFRPSRNGKKDEWERMNNNMWDVIPSGKKAEFTLKLGKGLGDRTCHLERTADTWSKMDSFVFQSDANYLSHCRDKKNDKVWVVCGDNKPGNEEATCAEKAFPKPPPPPRPAVTRER